MKAVNRLFAASFILFLPCFIFAAAVFGIASSQDSDVSGTVESDGFMFPLREFRSITSRFGYRTDPLTGEKKHHNGVDIAAAYGTPVYASYPGEVTTSGYNSSYGYVVFITHEDGLITVYAHNSQLNVSKGQLVSQGDVISFVGSTGRSTGNHLHFEMQLNGKRVDPLEFVTVPDR